MKIKFRIKSGGYNLKIFIYNNGVFLCGFAICLLLILLYAYRFGHYVNFYPINGVFQNYNPVRRLIDGQVPYKDFQDYLGMGHLLTGTIMTIMFGGTFNSSLMAFTFLTLMSFAGISYVVAMAIFNKRETAIFLTDIVILLLFVQPLIFTNILVGMYEIKGALDSALNVGNSARYVRGMILPVSCGLVCVGKKFLGKNIPTIPTMKYTLLTGIIAGFSFIWSNDYGISCWLCLTILTFWYMVCQRTGIKNAIIYTIIELLVSVFSIFILVEFFTLGHFKEWFSATFGIGGYQIWYYNSPKSYYVWDIDISFVVLIQTFICIYYLWKMMHNNANGMNNKYTILSYVNMVGICATEEYRMLSGGNSREIAFAVLFFTILYEIIQMIISIQKHIQKRMTIMIYVVVIISCTSWIISSAKEEFIFHYITEKEGIFINQLGGNISILGEDLIKTDKFLNGEKFFSTYASAQEVISNTYQPSGIDYIIHALGDV